MCSGKVSSSCSTSGSRRVNLVTNPVISHEWGKYREVLTTSGRYPWSYCDADTGGDGKTFEVMNVWMRNSRWILKHLVISIRIIFCWPFSHWSNRLFFNWLLLNECIFWRFYIFIFPFSSCFFYFTGYTFSTRNMFWCKSYRYCLLCKLNVTLLSCVKRTCHHIVLS